MELKRYTKKEQLLDKLTKELKDLTEKKEKLEKYIHSIDFEKIRVYQRIALIAQREYMTNYKIILELRIKDIKENEPQD